MTEVRDRRNVFGEEVGRYDSTRPGYPDALVDDVLAYAAPAGGPVLEVGAGTGKATVAFAARGLDLTCVEPDARMAEVLRRNCAPYPGVSVVVSQFETWAPQRPATLLYSAQAWHWVDERRRTDLAYAALAPGGALALFWNIFTVDDPDLHAALARVDARYGLGGDSPHRHRADEVTPTIGPDFATAWPALGLAGDPRFTDLTSRRYRRDWFTPTARYLDLMLTLSAYRMLEPPRREAVLTAVAEVLDAHGGGIPLAVYTDLALARRMPQDPTGR